MVMVTFRFHHINKFTSAIIMLIFSSVLIVLSVTTASAIISGASHPLRGSAIKCHNEGESVKVSLLSDDPCITCKCVNQEIVCQREICPNFKSCYIIFYEKNRTCCDICKGCWYNGQMYKSGHTFKDNTDPCKNFICNSGIITEYRPHCHVSCKNPVKVEGECCPSCNTCEIDGKFYNNGDTIPNISDDRCIECKCVNSNMICSKSSCPVLSCPQSKWMFQKNECCPMCKGHRKVNDFQGNCIMGLSFYRDGQSFNYDQCTDCICNSTTNICKRKVCPPLECPPSFQIVEPGECCGKCQGPQELQTKCVFGGLEYKSGDKWKMDNCHRCFCYNGEVRCTADICSKDLVCPIGHKLARVKGECCSSCIEDDAQCKVTDTLSNYTTFDGRNYEFQSQCNYILARDCREKQFSVHLVNKHKSSRPLSNSSLALTTIMVKIEETKVRLNNFGRVRVGRKRVRLPHIILGTLSIVQDGQKIVLRANIGVKVVWEYGNSVEITIPPLYKTRTCGLCGNYNGDPYDDFMTKRKAIHELERFTNSWKVGKNVICESHMQQSIFNTNTLTCLNDWEKQYDAINICNILKSSLFRSCHSSVSIAPYFGKCVKDICLCQKNDRCHCDAIRAYTNTCRKLGHDNPQWTKKILCETSDCPKGAIFRPCSSPCKRTCRNYRKLKLCRKPCRPGCDCPAGQVWHNGKCIYPKHCTSSSLRSLRYNTTNTTERNNVI